MPDLNTTLKPRLCVARNCAQVQSPFVLKGTAPKTIAPALRVRLGFGLGIGRGKGRGRGRGTVRVRGRGRGRGRGIGTGRKKGRKAPGNEGFFHTIRLPFFSHHCVADLCKTRQYMNHTHTRETRETTQYQPLVRFFIIPNDCSNVCCCPVRSRP